MGVGCVFILGVGYGGGFVLFLCVEGWGLCYRECDDCGGRSGEEEVGVGCEEEDQMVRTGCSQPKCHR